MTSAPAPVQESQSPDPVAVPADHLCARCGYPSGRSGSRTCPECGWEATAPELHAAETRREAVARWRGGERERTVAGWFGIIAVYAFGAGAVARSAGAVTGALFAASFAVVISWKLGDWFAARCRRERREYLGMIWSRSLWMLHLPWLVSPLFVAVAVFIGLVDLWAGQSGSGAYYWAVLAGFFVWLAGCVVAFVAWWRERVRAIAAGGYPLGRADAVAFFIGGAVLAGAMGLGFAAGVGAAVGIAEWLRLDEVLWE